MDIYPQHEEPQQNLVTNAVYLRIVLYVLSTLLAMIPLSWSSWVSYDAASGMLQISVPGLAAAVTLGIVSAMGIYKKWGAK